MASAVDRFRSISTRHTPHASRITHYVLRITHHALRITYHVLRIACFVLLLAACQVPSPVQPTVKIGLVAPFEGRYRYVGYDVIYAVRLALQEANALGGVGGYGVELVAYDDGADPVMAVEQARKLAVDPAVVAVVGHFREEATVAASGAYADEGISLVAPAVLDPALAGGGTWHSYRMGPSADAVASGLLRQLDRLGRDRVALLGEGGALGAALQRNAPATFALVVSPRDLDWLARVQDSGVRAIVCDLDPVTCGEGIAALRGDGWEGDFLGGPELAAPDFCAVAGQAAGGVAFVTPWPLPADVPGGEDFVKAYRAVSNGVPPGRLALPAYEATWLLLGALERDIAVHGDPTREGVAETLAGASRTGPLGWITFDASRAWGDAPLYWYRVGADGAVEPVRTGAAAP
jgi:ABC-type branched-subunit amino acid transport system substrate-binding protein